MKQTRFNLWQWMKDHPWVWIVALAALLPLTWFGSAYLVTGTDINFPLDPIYRLTSRFQLWDASFITGRDLSVALPTQVFAGVQALLSWLGFGNTWVEQLELVFWLGASGLSGVFFFNQLLVTSSEHGESAGKELGVRGKGSPHLSRLASAKANASLFTPHQAGALLGVTIYLFNIFLLNRINEIDVATLGAYVFVPALLGFSLAAIGGRVRPWVAGLGAALVSVLGVGLFANPPLVLVLGIFYIAFAIVLLLTHTRAARINFTRFFAVFVGSFILVHLWWLLPYIGSLNVLVGGEDGLASLNLLDWVDGVSRHNNFWNVIRMQGAWDWYEKGLEDKPYVPTALHYQRNFFVIVLSLILPLGALWSLKVLPTLDKAKKWLWWFFAIALVISLIYSMGTNNVVSTFIYDATSKIVPGFWLIRSPWYKFGYITVLGYGVLFAYLGAWLTTKNEEGRMKKGTSDQSPRLPLFFIPYSLFKRWSVALIALGIILYAYPMLFGRTQLFPYTRLKNGVPSYITEATDFLNKQSDTHRVVALPQEDAYNYTWGYGSGGDVIGHFLRRPVLSNETFAGGNRQGSDALLAAFYRSLYDTLPGEMSLLLDYLDGQYFIHKNDAKFADYGDTDSPDFIRERLKLHPTVQFVRSFGQWDLYKRTDEAPGRIITGTKLWTMFGPSTDYIKELPYYLEHLKGEDELTQFYTRPLDQEAGPGTTRSLMKVEMPRVEGDTLIETMDFDAPFDGPITVEQITGSASGTLTLNDTTVSDGSSAELKRESNVFSVTPQRLPDVIDNPSFAEPVELGFPGPGPWNFSDSNKTAPGDAKFKIRQIPGSDDTPGIELEATNHILGLHQWIQDFENLAIYRISFDYKHVKGQAPAYTTWQATSAVDKPNGTLPISTDWQHFSTYVQTDARSTGLLVYLYAGAELGETTINHYDNVRVEKVGTRTTFAFFSPEAERPAPPAVTFTQQSNTHWTAHIEKSEGPYLLSFLESFNPGWVAVVNGKQIAEDKHVKVNGYANAWWMEQNSEPMDIDIRYTPQDRFALYGWVSIITILMVIAGLLIARFRRKA